MWQRHLAALTAPFVLLASPAAADEAELVQAGSTPQGALSLNLRTQHDHHGHGYQRVAAVLELNEPLAGAGRSIPKLELTEDWDCARRRVRTVQITRRAWNGEHAGADYSNGPWRRVADAGGEARAWEIICPSEAAAVASPPASRAPPPPRRRRSSAEVIVMPRGPDG